MGRRGLRHPLPLALLVPFTFLSGAGALVYEIVWTRWLSLSLGSTTEAMAAVLSSFMLGLALGAFVVGRGADQAQRPLRRYGLLEIGIGVYALMFPALLSLSREHWEASPWILAFLLLLLPAALMGGTLPVLARAAAESASGATRALGFLYAVNTLGATVGALLTTFVLIPEWGLELSVQITAAMHILLGLLCWLLSLQAGRRRVDAPPAKTPRTRRSRLLPETIGLRVMGAFFLAGFCGLSLQVAWTRLLVYVLEGFTIAFGLMLTTYLLGLALGAGFGTILAIRTLDPRRLLARLLAVEAFLTLASLFVAEWLVDPVETLRSARGAEDVLGTGYAVALLVGASAVLVPATICAGALLPVMSRLAFLKPERIGQDAGLIYAASTVGAVLAPPVAGFLLIPSLTVRGAVGAAGAVLLGAAALTVSWKGWAPKLRAVGVGAAFCVVLFLASPDTPAIQRSHVFGKQGKVRRLLHFAEGEVSGVSVVEDLRYGNRLLYTDGFLAAETGPRYEYMRMLGHLPLLLHPNPKSVLVIAFGTGTTAGAVSLHDDVESIVCVEIEEQVYRAASWFRDQNRGVLRRRGTLKAVADGREFVRHGGRDFDVITLEPLMPYTPAAVHLYTQEFYEDASARLRPGGFLCQWIPVHALSTRDLKRLVRTAEEVFPWVSLWYFHQSAVVLCGEAPLRAEQERFWRRAAHPPIAADLHRALVGGPNQLLACEAASGRRLRTVLADVEPLRDDRTDLEYRPLPRGFGRRSLRYKAQNLKFLAELHKAGAPPNASRGLLRARQATGRLLELLSREYTERLKYDRRYPPALEFATESGLREVMAQHPRALHVRSEWAARVYKRLAAAQRWEEAIKVWSAPDRSAAFLAMAKAATDPTKRRAYQILAVRENGLIDAATLEALAEGQPEEIRRWCLNRARRLRGEALEPGAETPPPVPIKMEGLARQLRSGTPERVAALFVRARQHGLEELAEQRVEEWLQEGPDLRRAAGILDAARSRSRLGVALNLRNSGTPADLAAAAPIFCDGFPTLWRPLCRHESAVVREAAASAAADRGGPLHAPILAEMCGDEAPDVRLAAFISLRRLVPAVREVDFDPRSPDPKKLAVLKRLAGS